MKGTVSLFFTLLFSCNISCSVARESIEWPVRSNGLSLFASTLIGAFTPVNLSFDHYKHTGVVHWGYTTGLTLTFCEGAKYATFGGHFAAAMMTGRSKNHFEGKLGFSYSPVLVYSKQIFPSMHLNLFL